MCNRLLWDLNMEQVHVKFMMVILMFLSAPDPVSKWEMKAHSSRTGRQQCVRARQQ